MPCSYFESHGFQHSLVIFSCIVLNFAARLLSSFDCNIVAQIHYFAYDVMTSALLCQWRIRPLPVWRHSWNNFLNQMFFVKRKIFSRFLNETNTDTEPDLEWRHRSSFERAMTSCIPRRRMIDVSYLVPHHVVRFLKATWSEHMFRRPVEIFAFNSMILPCKWTKYCFDCLETSVNSKTQCTVNFTHLKIISH